MVFESKDDIKYLIILIKERYNIFIFFFYISLANRRKFVQLILAINHGTVLILNFTSLKLPQNNIASRTC